MTTLPEEAVKAAMAAHNKYYDDLVIYPSEEPTPEGAFHAALKGALPFLPVQGAVKKLKWNEYNDEQGIPDRWDAEASSFGVFYSIEIQHDGYRVVFDHEAVGAVGIFDTLEAAKAAAQADYEARIKSALEPSAARELHGPFGYIVGHHDLREDEWSLENDPVNEEDATNGLFSVPLYTLTDPFKEIGIDGRSNAASPSARELALEEAARNLVAVRYDTYKARNGKLCSIEGDDGEKAWIVPFDAMAELESALSPDHADAGGVEGDGWLPIERAPKDGAEIIYLTKYGSIGFCRYAVDDINDWFGWWDLQADDEVYPRRWLPRSALPTPPSSEVA